MALAKAASQPGREAGRQARRQGVAEPTAPLFTPSFTTNNAAEGKEGEEGGKCASLLLQGAYSLGFK